MKFAKNIVFVLFITISSISCLNTNYEQANKIYYDRNKRLFPKELTGHFPDQAHEGSIDGYTRFSNEKLADSCFSPSEFVISNGYKQEDYLAIKQKFLHNKYVIHPSDTNIILLMSYCDVLIIDGDIFRNREDEKTKELAKKNSYRDNSIPIPIFKLEDFKQVDNPCNLSSDFIIYVIDAQPGIYLDNKILNECVCMPNNWKHGFSRGVALNDKENIVIYWLEIW